MTGSSNQKFDHDRLAPTQVLADFVASTSFEDLPGSVIEQTKMLILDAFGCGLLGGEADVSERFSQVGAQFGTDATATIWGGGRASSYVAAMLNSASIHLTELAEGTSRAGVHTSSTCVPGGLATAERVGASGRDFLRAIAMASETLIRFGITLARDPATFDVDNPRGDNMVSFLQGWCTPILLSPIGSGTASALLQGFDSDRLHQTWGIAANLAPAASITVFAEGISAKGMLMGMGCASGMVSADLAATGITGTSDLVSSWMPVVVPTFDPRALVSELGTVYEMEYVLYKWFATIGPLFAPLEASLAIVDELGRPDPATIERIHVTGYRRTVEISGYAWPSTSEEAKANLPYVVATAILDGNRETFLRDAFRRDRYESSDVRKLMGLVSVSIDPDYENLYPYHAAKARVDIHLTDGTRLSREVDRDAIAQYHFPTRSQIAEKFRRSAGDQLAPERIESLIELVWDLENVDDVDLLAQLLGKGP